VTICDRWKDSFENFLADLGERPPGTTLGRFGDIGNYTPLNCKWMTSKEQRENWKPDRNMGFCKKTSEQIAATGDNQWGESESLHIGTHHSGSAQLN
jgi:hypothetical protein